MATKKCPYCAAELQEEMIICPHCGHNLLSAPPPVAPLPTKQPTKKDLLVAGVILCTVIAAIFIVRALVSSTLPPPRAAAPAPVSTTPPLRYAWVNGIVDCPSSPEYKQLVVSEINLWDSPNMGRVIAKIAHGKRIEILAEKSANEFYKVRYGGQIGYVQSLLVIDYDPAGGIKPNHDHCW